MTKQQIKQLEKTDFGLMCPCTKDITKAEKAKYNNRCKSCYEERLEMDKWSHDYNIKVFLKHYKHVSLVKGRNILTEKLGYKKVSDQSLAIALIQDVLPNDMSVYYQHVKYDTVFTYNRTTKQWKLI